MNLTEHDIDRIQAALDRAKNLGTVSESDLCRAVHQAFKGLYTLRQVEEVERGAYA